MGMLNPAPKNVGGRVPKPSLILTLSPQGFDKGRGLYRWPETTNIYIYPCIQIFRCKGSQFTWHELNKIYYIKQVLQHKVTYYSEHLMVKVNNAPQNWFLASPWNLGWQRQSIRIQDLARTMVCIICYLELTFIAGQESTSAKENWKMLTMWYVCRFWPPL